MRSNRGYNTPTICQQCGQTYYVKPYEIGRTRYCSLTCRNTGYAIDPAILLTRGVTAPDKHGCRHWRGATRAGYGAIRVDGRMVGTHVFSYALANKIPLAELRQRSKIHITHLCDRFYAPGDITYRRCIEPTHLTLDTPAGNNRHTHEVGRQAKNVDYKWRRGTAHHAAKLTETDVLAMRAAAATGIDAKALAHQFGVSHQTAWRIVKRTLWTHI